MNSSIIKVTAAALGIAAETPVQHALVRQRFLSMKKQFPWIYAIFVVNLMGLHFMIVPAGYSGFDPTLIFLGIIAVRLFHWFRLGDSRIPDDMLQRQLMKTFILATVICGTFCVWLIFLYSVNAPRHPASVIIFANLTTVGVFYGLSNFPAAARAPIYCIGVPVTLLLLTSNDPTQIAIGFAQATLIILMLRMSGVQDRAFVRLVSTRFDMDSRRLSAVQAEKSALEERARYGVIANTDSLTGLDNRRALMAALGSSLTRENAAGLVIIDLDGFKPINDTFGHPAGDKLLVEVGARLIALVGSRGTAARLGGDEFALLVHTYSEEEAKNFAEEAVRQLSEPYAIDERIMSISACAGVAWKGESKPAAPLMREADIALYSSKNRGRGLITAFTMEMQGEIQRKTEIEQALRQPGLIDRISLAYQPIFDLDSLEIQSFEALARWEHPELGWISPAEFIPITEQIGVIEELNDSLLRRAATVALSWPTTVMLSFNLSPIQLSSKDSGARVLAIVRDLNFPPERLQVEVTETALMADFNVARDNLATLRRAGARIVLDDFGAGYASISYLREINFDAIKLDGSLVTSIAEAASALPTLRGVLALCQAMERPCIAEHVETPTQLVILREMGCQYGQGYFLALPMDGAAATELAHCPDLDISPTQATALRA